MFYAPCEKLEATQIEEAKVEIAPAAIPYLDEPLIIGIAWYASEDPELRAGLWEPQFARPGRLTPCNPSFLRRSSSGPEAVLCWRWERLQRVVGSQSTFASLPVQGLKSRVEGLYSRP